MNAYNSPRSMAVAIWSFAVGWLALIPPELSAGTSFFLVLLVSTASSLAQLLVNRPDPFHSSMRLNRPVSLAISWAISLLWAVVLGGKLPESAVVMLLATAILPTCLTWLATISSTKNQSRNSQTLDSSRPTGQIEPPHVIESLETKMLRRDDELSDSDEEAESTLGFSPIDFDSPSAAEITQWQTRCRRETGETSEGGIQVEFAEGQREVTVHLSFCPPFAQSPKLLTEDLDGADLEIRVAASFPFGARLAVRRPLRSSDRATQSLAETCRIGFVATSESIRRAA